MRRRPSTFKDMKPCSHCITPSVCTRNIKCQDRDTVIFPTSKFWVTFGFGHHMGPEKRKLASCYTTVEAVNTTEASHLMWAKRGSRWSYMYDKTEQVGVDKYKLTYVPYEDLMEQEGDNL